MKNEHFHLNIRNFGTYVKKMPMRLRNEKWVNNVKNKTLFMLIRQPLVAPNFAYILCQLLIKNLLYSDLRFNHIKEVPSNAFKGLTQLHSIFLNENQITTIHNDAFSGLPGLRYLYLNQNHIKNIAANAFINLTRLERLWVERNFIHWGKAWRF